VFFWGEADMMWTSALTELFEVRRRRKAVQQLAQQLVEEAEAWLAGKDLPRRPVDDPPAFN
jgi:hypothetical protein